jgi:hypothetical protein
MLVDSNILIYAAQLRHAQLRQFIADHAPAVSAVSYVEVLGYHHLDAEERQYLEEFFRLAQVFPLSQAVLDQAVALPATTEDVPRRCARGRHGIGA